nr:unnamed protein product [Callosobruchus analis]
MGTILKELMELGGVGYITSGANTVLKTDELTEPNYQKTKADTFSLTIIELSVIGLASTTTSQEALRVYQSTKAMITTSTQISENSTLYLDLLSHESPDGVEVKKKDVQSENGKYTFFFWEFPVRVQ